MLVTRIEQTQDPVAERNRRSSWRPGALVPLGVWLCTRAVFVGMALAGTMGADFETHSLYPSWAAELAHGHFPFGDAKWQYPPVAGLVFLAPRALPFLSYPTAFSLLMLLCDAAVAAMLLTGSRGAGRSVHGLWLWTLGLPLLIQLPYVRFDVAVTALAVGSVLLLTRSATGSGLLAALGALTKAWPVLMLIGTPRGRVTRRSWTAAVVGMLVVTGVLALVFTHEFSFLGEQGSRGIEVESLPGSLLLLARMFGYHASVHYSYGSYQVSGRFSDGLADLAVLGTVVGFGWLLWWRLRARTWNAATPADAALTAMLIFVSTSRVISPQYLVWLLGLGAVCLVFTATGQRPVALSLLPITALTALVYPALWTSLLHGHGLGRALAVLVLLLRNAALLAATLYSALRLWRGTEARGLRSRGEQTRAG